MQDEGMGEQQERLESEVLADPGAPSFAALAELYRRQGRPADAEAVARAGLSVKPDMLEGRVALALALLDRGLEVEARDELEAVLGSNARRDGVSLGASSRPGEVEAVEASPPADEAPAAPVEGVPVEGAFATETMAGLLEQQGDRASAERIRAALTPADDAPGAGAQAPVVQELQRWLANARQRMEGRA